jgi:hypothetical protein
MNRLPLLCEGAVFILSMRPSSEYSRIDNTAILEEGGAGGGTFVKGSAPARLSLRRTAPYSFSQTSPGFFMPRSFATEK